MAQGAKDWQLVSGSPFGVAVGQHHEFIQFCAHESEA
jgi:hypothetical protein